MTHNWFWAARRDGPAEDAFVIENGQDALWARVQSEIDPNEQVYWDALHRGSSEPNIGHVLQLLLTTVPTYRVNHNRFVFEAAKIPCFARFLREAPVNLSEFVANSVYPDALIPLEAYSANATARLGEIASETLHIDSDWFDR